jgi:hypothetical protein
MGPMPKLGISSWSGGSAGGVVAARLTEDAAASVLLLEITDPQTNSWANGRISVKCFDVECSLMH